jgi:alcohol dehydrogenase
MTTVPTSAPLEPSIGARTTSVGPEHSSSRGDVPLGLLRAPRTTIFGPGQRAVLGAQVARLGRVALLCTDERLSTTPEFQQMTDDLRDHGVRLHVWTDTEPELPTRGILACHEAVAGQGVDVVVGIGGGSCLDMAKAVALLLRHGGPLQTYYGEEAVPGPVLPIVAVPTTGGTGSEASPVCVLNDDRRELKTGISSTHLIPTLAICDPELTISCPPKLSASAGADALAHLVESFTAVRRPPSVLAEKRVFIGKNVISDHYARWGLALLAGALPAVLEDPGDLAARSDVMLAANAGGYALGVAGTTAAHALQYPLGALTHSAHGVGVGALLPYVLRYNAPARIVELGEIATLLGVPGSGADPLDRAEAGVSAVEELLERIGIPATLADLGLAADQVDYVARMGLESKRLVDNNPRPLDLEAMTEITENAYTGTRKSLR